MKPEHNYLTIEDLKQKLLCYVESISIKNLLLWGAEGKIQFLVKLKPGGVVERITIKCSSCGTEAVPDYGKHYVLSVNTLKDIDGVESSTGKIWLVCGKCNKDRNVIFQLDSYHPYFDQFRHEGNKVSSKDLKIHIDEVKRFKDKYLNKEKHLQHKEKWQEQVKPVEVQEGTTINQIEIRFENLTDVEISIAGCSEIITRNYESLGFRDNQRKKENEWNKAWILLRDIAIASGSFGYKEINAREGRIDGIPDSRALQRFKDTLVGINKRLKYAFSILRNDPPIKYSNNKKNWEASFTLGLTKSYYDEMIDNAPNLEGNLDIQIALLNAVGHIHAKSADDNDRYNNK